MALLFLPLLLFPIFTTITISDGAWCVCKPELSDTMLQKTIDYACGAGADCNPIIKNGPCFNPDTVKSHCNYAANSYYQRKGQAQGSCDFSGTAILTSSDPSVNGCSYPSSASTASSTTTTTSPGSSTTTTTTPGSLTPSTTGTGGVMGSLGPSTASPDFSEVGYVLQAKISSVLFYLIIFSCLLYFRV
ncbi:PLASMODESMATA CALLOSE-BINDING PROTEIN 3-like [Dioscorea cayenensis subsp. rotundata]|uniref:PLASMODESMATA CALLOSE-BINDING PROTEIN 3-like n=1 Tax=Dioscorea cayennensis subsp. rotundata TaxID=55577 RepID=A0AB40CLN4_DIOCR|nr:PLASMODESMATA CALLOSE-BINDING PROTEIN 3-like [Dioscorea cayenensis subsp. rotundata]